MSAARVVLAWLGWASGGFLVLLAARAVGNPPLSRRLGRYLGGEFGATGQRQGGATPPGAGRARVVALLSRADALLGARTALEARLTAAGVGDDAGSFRVKQLISVLVAGAATLAAATAGAAHGASVRPAAVIAAAAGSGTAAAGAWSIWLKHKAVARKRSITAQLPEAVDLICVSVVAGESLRAALDRAAGVMEGAPVQRGATAGGGALAAELRMAMSQMRAGASLAQALRALAQRNGVPALTKLVDSLLLAQERGTALADQLAVLAAEVREKARRELIEAAGRRQVRMLVPIVFLILPTALAFAFFPGLVALRLLIRQ